jgi:hypothetical protein
MTGLSALGKDHRQGSPARIASKDHRQQATICGRARHLWQDPLSV